MGGEGEGGRGGTKKKLKSRSLFGCSCALLPGGCRVFLFVV